MKTRSTHAVLLAILVFISILSGCVRADVSVKVSKDGIADISVLYAVSNMVYGMTDSSISLSAEDIAKYEASGVVVTHYIDNDAGYTGYSLKKQGIDLHDMSSKRGDVLLDSSIGSIFSSPDSCFSIDGNKVTLSFVPFSSEDYSEMGSYLPMIKTYNGYVTFSLDLPVKPTVHNATSVSEDGKKLNWDLTVFGPNEKVYAEFALPSRLPMLFIGALGAFAIFAGVVAIVVFSVVRKKNQKRDDDIY